MRIIVKGIVPKKILNLQKKGFTPPFVDYLFSKSWRVELNKSINYLLDLNLLDKDKEYKLKNSNECLEKDLFIQSYLFSKWAEKWLRN